MDKLISDKMDELRWVENHYREKMYNDAIEKLKIKGNITRKKLMRKGIVSKGETK